jgi:hypothetical protein
MCTPGVFYLFIFINFFKNKILSEISTIWGVFVIGKTTRKKCVFFLGGLISGFSSLKIIGFYFLLSSNRV